MNTFENLGINETILKKIKEKGFDEPTFIQEKTIPLILEGKDVVGQSATGSGKTLAFGCGLIEHIEKKDGLQGLVLTPTRELAEQVCEALAEFATYKGLSIIPVYGGVSINIQISKLRKTNIVVATPGRLLDHLERQTIDLSRVKILVLDEADRMVDMGFVDDVRKIISQCPEKRQTLLFSATMSDDIEKIKHNYMHEPITVAVKSQVDPAKLKQVYYDVKQNSKFSLLVHLLKGEDSDSIIVFCNTRRMVDTITKNLYKNDVKAEAIHGGFTQAKRSKALEKFQNKKVDVLVCTDVAARGLDIKGVSHVYNYDIPKESKDYIHRVGRTARAGKKGKAVNILSPRDHENFGRVLNEFPQLKVERIDVPLIKEHIDVKMVEERGGGDRSRGNRGNMRKGPNRAGPRRPSGNRDDRRGPRSSERSSEKNHTEDREERRSPRAGPRRPVSHSGPPKKRTQVHHRGR